MQTVFPSGIDFPDSPSAKVRNKAQMPMFNLDDVAQLIHDIEVKVGINDSEDNGSLDYRIARLEESVAALPETRRGATVVTAGTNTIEFEELTTSIYMIKVYLILDSSEHVGEQGTAIPVVPPNTDSRTTTRFEINCNDSGILYWEVTTYEN